MNINFKVNEKPVSVEVSPDMVLLDFLRDGLGLTGSKKGCSSGECGACTVLVDSKPKQACRLKMKEMKDKTVLTIEGLGSPAHLHPVQSAFIETAAVQCGFCTPGMIMRVKALLDRNPDPSEAEIKSYLSTNLCRCTGYQAIIRAVNKASQFLKGELKPALSKRKAIGESHSDRDAPEKVTGRTKFSGDVSKEGMLHGKVLLSRRPHARILKIDTSDALKIPGIICILTHKDIGGPNRFGRVKKDQPVLVEDKVRFVGDVVAVVFGETTESAIRGRDAVKITYEDLPGVFDPRDALSGQSIEVHSRGNLLQEFDVNRGNTHEAFSKSDIVIEEYYSTPFVEHGYMETEAGLAVPDSNGGVTIWFGTQIPFLSRKQVAENLNIPEEKVRIVSTHVGGGFGGKNDVSIEILLALGALKTGKPVKITLTREESMLMSTKRHPFYMRYKTGATSKGALTALEVEFVIDSGAYASVSKFVLEQAVIFAGGPYYWPTVKVSGKAAYTNNPIGGAFRGYGINQVHFAVETQMDMMARAISLDPLDFRMRNALESGKPTITGEVLKENVAVKDTIAKITEALKKEKMKSSGSHSAKKIGIGVASGYKNIGAGRGSKENAGAYISLSPEGRILIRVTAVDMGQQLRTVLCQIASEVIGIDVEHIDIITGDTLQVPEGISASAQRQTYISGSAVLEASRKFKASFLASATRLLDMKVIDTQDNQMEGKNGEIDIFSIAQSLARKGEKLEEFATHTVSPTFSVTAESNEKAESYRNYPAYNYCTQAAIVEVDENNIVRVVKIIAAHDAGTVLNPNAVRGQLEGGLVMGLGYALSENFQVQNGYPTNLSLRKIGIPTFKVVPEMEIFLVEDPVLSGPFGAKGVSEIALVPTAPAITNAIFDATGIRITSLPVSRQLYK